jgi:Holliday junction resolvase RusA-like endonuclease
MIINLKDVNIVSDNRRLIPIVVKGRPRSVTSAEYKKCKEDLIRMIREQLPEWWEPMSEGVEIEIGVHTYKDLSNVAKVICDALQGAKVIKNDRYIDILRMYKTPTKRGSLDTVSIEIKERMLYG